MRRTDFTSPLMMLNQYVSLVGTRLILSSKVLVSGMRLNLTVSEIACVAGGFLGFLKTEKTAGYAGYLRDEKCLLLTIVPRS